MNTKDEFLAFRKMIAENVYHNSNLKDPQYVLNLKMTCEEKAKLFFLLDKIICDNGFSK